MLQMPAGDGFVELYYAVTPTEQRSLSHCGKLLELKGVKPDETRQLLALLRRHTDVPRDDGVSDAAPVGKAAEPPTIAVDHSRKDEPAVVDEDDGPGAALRRRLRDMSVGSQFISRLKWATRE